jgi:hypothetical protein
MVRFAMFRNLVIVGRALLGSDQTPRPLRYGAIVLLILTAILSAWAFTFFSSAPHMFMYELF